MTERTTPSAKIIADSISPQGQRLTTFEVEFHRFVLAEFNTHRVFCLSGDSEIWTEQPNGTARKMKLIDLYDKWHNGAAPRHSKKGADWPVQVLVASRSYEAREVAHLLGMANASNLNGYCRSGRVRGAVRTPQGAWMATGTEWASALAPTVNRQPMRDRLAAISVRQVSEADMEPSLTRITDVIYSGEKETFSVSVGNKVIRTSGDHLFLTPDGWSRLKELAPGSKVAVSLRGKPDHLRHVDRYKKVDGRWVNQWVRSIKHLLPTICECGEPAVEAHHEIPVHVDTSKAFDLTNLTHLCDACHDERHRTQGWQEGVPAYYDFAEIDSIESYGVEHTFDLSVAGDDPNFVANGFVVHNSRNSASSRAIPVQKQLTRATVDPAFPIKWTSEQPGMQGGTELKGRDLKAAKDVFSSFQFDVVTLIEDYLQDVADEYGLDWDSDDPDEIAELKSHTLHKSLLNRLIEPIMWHKVIVTAAEYENFYKQRVSPLAQPEIEVAAAAMYALSESTPVELQEGEWHTPYISAEEKAENDDEVTKRVSVARCARVSYLTHDGVRDTSVDLGLYEKLVSADPPHWSPTEHVATPDETNMMFVWEFDPDEGDTTSDTPAVVPVIGNFAGWRQMRHEFKYWEYPL